MKESTKEKIFLGLTAARLFQGARYSKRVKDGKPIKAATAAIIAVDLLDGILARWAGADGPKRRAADSMVDSAIIGQSLLAGYQKHPKARPYIGALAAREIFVASGWALDLSKSRQVKKGDDFHKLASLAIAAFGVAAHHGSERMMKSAGALAFSVNAVLAYDYFRGWTDPKRTRMLDSGVVEVAGFFDARVALHRFATPLPQLEAGSARPELDAGSPILELQEYNGNGSLPPGTYREMPLDT